jgi:hypothetical protein
MVQLSRNLPQLAIALCLLWSAAAARANDPPAALTGADLLVCERRLRALGYWIEAADGRLDDSTLAAITAFRRVNGYRNPGVPNAADLPVLLRAKPLRAQAGKAARFEVDIRRQVMFFADEAGRVSLILPVSTGSGTNFVADGRTRIAGTPRGRFRVFRKMEGWHESPLGRMYYPTYIVGGVAIHGSSYVAEYPRTHGCIAVPIFAAVRLSELMPLGTLVIVRR